MATHAREGGRRRVCVARWRPSERGWVTKDSTFGISLVDWYRSAQGSGTQGQRTGAQQPGPTGHEGARSSQLSAEIHNAHKEIPRSSRPPGDNPHRGHTHSHRHRRGNDANARSHFVRLAGLPDPPPAFSPAPACCMHADRRPAQRIRTWGKAGYDH